MSTVLITRIIPNTRAGDHVSSHPLTCIGTGAKIVVTLIQINVSLFSSLLRICITDGKLRVNRVFIETLSITGV